jgi:hypothetical protein
MSFLQIVTQPAVIVNSYFQRKGTMLEYSGISANIYPSETESANIRPPIAIENAIRLALD